MDALNELERCLAAIADRELHGLRAATAGAPPAVPGLMAWLDAALDWERDRRAGHDYPLRGPMEAIPDNEVATSILALDLMSGAIRSGKHDGSALPVVSLFELLTVILRAEAERPNSVH